MLWMWYVNSEHLIRFTFCYGSIPLLIIFHLIFLSGLAWSLEGDKVKHVVAVDSLPVKFRCVSECLTGSSNPSGDKEGTPKWYLMICGMSKGWPAWCNQKVIGRRYPFNFGVPCRRAPVWPIWHENEQHYRCNFKPTIKKCTWSYLYMNYGWELWF